MVYSWESHDRAFAAVHRFPIFQCQILTFGKELSPQDLRLKTSLRDSLKTSGLDDLKIFPRALSNWRSFRTLLGYSYGLGVAWSHPYWLVLKPPYRDALAHWWWLSLTGDAIGLYRILFWMNSSNFVIMAYWCLKYWQNFFATAFFELGYSLESTDNLWLYEILFLPLVFFMSGKTLSNLFHLFLTNEPILFGMTTGFGWFNPQGASPTSFTSKNYLIGLLCLIFVLDIWWAVDSILVLV